VIFETDSYALELAGHGRRVELRVGDAVPLALSLLSGVDRVDAADETLALSEPDVRGNVVVVERRSTIWEHARVELHCLDEVLEVRTFVRGSGAIGTVRLLGGRSLLAGTPLGPSRSGTRLTTLFSPNPEDHAEPFRRAGEGAAIGVVGDSEPGRTRWLFTPAPLYVALADDAAADEWVGLALAAPVDELRFPELVVEPAPGAFALRLEYEGRTTAAGELALPTVLVTPRLRDPYAGLRRYRDELVRLRAAPAPAPRARPAWWSEPIFCGWGAQCHLETTLGGLARDYATEARYDAFLERLEERGVVPGTVVLDDKWQATYGRNEPDTAKWPDLRRWIATRHERGQRVLLWWKAWDPEGLPAELCIRTPDGTPVAFDPANPAARDELRAIVTELLSPDDLDADGFKVDFTARTPTGTALTGGGGIALLHELLAIVYGSAKAAKPDALVITHTPHPAFVDVTDMIRLNDMIGGPLVPQMLYRAEVARAACPELPIDTDDWRAPDKRSWRDYLERKPELGIPSLYYATHLDTGEELDADDYAAIRRVWETWREQVRRAAA
jgi:hypothetical protein